MYSYFQQLFDMLNTRDYHITIIIVYVSLYAAAVLLRTITCASYRSALFAFRLEAKDLKAREEIKKIRHGSLRKIAAEYIRIADKSVSRIPTQALVSRQVDSFSLLGWRYVSIMPFVESLETGLALIGVIFALAFGEYAFMYGVLAAGGFALTRLTAAFFDFRAARSHFADELLIYVEREIGRFYAADSGGAVLRLKDELSAAIAKQSHLLRESVDKIGERMAEAVEKSFTGINDSLKVSLDGWAQSLADAGKVQAAINASTERMQASGASLQSASDLLARHLQGHSAALSEQLISLVSAVEAIKESNEQTVLAQEAFIKQTEYIEKNQRTLETTVQAYEASLQNLTQMLADGFGASLQIQTQNSVQAVNESLAAHIERVTAGNREILQHMQVLFDQLRSQSRDVSANLLSLHEKISETGGG